MAEPQIISHWSHLIDGFSQSPKEFYAVLQESIQKREIPDVSFDTVGFPESGPFSATREYLRVQRKDYTFDMCAAPFGRGVFVSWWLFTLPGCLGALAEAPVFGYFVRRFVRPLTYFRVDTALMFQSAVHSSLLEVLDGMTTAHGIRAVPELERRPIMREFFDR